jgi:hypothetical protein
MLFVVYITHASASAAADVSSLGVTPTTEWQTTDGAKGYACFVSHFKQQAGSDARYLADLLTRMLKAPVFIDSAEVRPPSERAYEPCTCAGHSDGTVCSMRGDAALRPAQAPY